MELARGLPLGLLLGTGHNSDHSQLYVSRWAHHGLKQDLVFEVIWCYTGGQPWTTILLFCKKMLGNI